MMEPIGKVGSILGFPDDENKDEISCLGSEKGDTNIFTDIKTPEGPVFGKRSRENDVGIDKKLIVRRGTGNLVPKVDFCVQPDDILGPRTPDAVTTKHPKIKLSNLKMCFKYDASLANRPIWKLNNLLMNDVLVYHRRKSQDVLVYGRKQVRKELLVYQRRKKQAVQKELLVYQRRRRQVGKHVENTNMSKEKKLVCCSPSTQICKGPKKRVLKEMPRPVLMISKHPRSRKQNKKSPERSKSEMHFSHWKGSVIDSIVGAYLTQNVSDTLSSSAFISLAAKYPVGPTRVNSRKKSVQKRKSKDICFKTDTNSKRKRMKKEHNVIDWNALRKNCPEDDRGKYGTLDALDWDAVRMAEVDDIAEAIKKRGMNNNLAARIKNCLNTLERDLGSIDLEWIRDVPPHKAKYELHCQMITIGKVFCTKRNPNCNACPMRAECKHYASFLASTQPSLPDIQEKDDANLSDPMALAESHMMIEVSDWDAKEPVERDIEDFGLDEIPEIIIDDRKLKENIQKFINKRNIPLQEAEMSNTLRVLTSESGSIHVTKLKNLSYLRTQHQVYVLPDSHYVLAGLEKREPRDSCPYLLAIWTPENVNKNEYISQEDRVYGTLLVPSRTAMRGIFPLNGTYFQANEVTLALSDAVIR
ncbi:UNVERIFIED_CONTAM: protein ROS1A [Sesamum radiatum]|uniref:Protein ROS1A n=1 Tax=Sesamum radiatum TaxID=300843 RepID=A0AAW2USB0_SESRA